MVPVNRNKISPPTAQKSSLEVKLDEILNSCGPCRLMSVDGGHTEDVVMSDLKLAESVLTENGVAILDDFFNQYWLGVAAGVSRHFMEPTTDLRPFAITPNKMHSARKSHTEFYRNMMRASHSRFYEKTAGMFGYGRIRLSSKYPCREWILIGIPAFSEE